jgi:membrane protease subunit HflC
MNRIAMFLGAVLLAILLASSSLFVVDQTQAAVIATFGEIRSVIMKPGLYFHWPLVQTVALIDRRIQTLDTNDSRPIFTAEKKSLVIDWLVKWRVTDPRQYIRTNGVSQSNLESRLSAVTQAAFNEEVTRHTVRGVLSDERDQVMQNVQKRLDEESKSFGIEIVDVRIKRVDFVQDITEAVYNRMRSERDRVAKQLRAEGKAEEERIRAEADRQRATIIAAATLEAQKIKGEGDAKASAIYADAFGRDPRFAAFYRSLQAYRQSFQSKADVMVIDGSTDFFRAMRSPDAATGSAPDSAANRKHN